MASVSIEVLPDAEAVARRGADLFALAAQEAAKVLHPCGRGGRRERDERHIAGGLRGGRASASDALEEFEEFLLDGFGGGVVGGDDQDGVVSGDGADDFGPALVVEGDGDGVGVAGRGFEDHLVLRAQHVAQEFGGQLLPDSLAARESRLVRLVLGFARRETRNHRNQRRPESRRHSRRRTSSGDGLGRGEPIDELLYGQVRERNGASWLFHVLIVGNKAPFPFNNRLICLSRRA